MTDECWSIINALPTYQWMDAPFFACFRNNNSETNDMDKIQKWLHDQCMSRFADLLQQSTTSNQRQKVNRSKFNKPNLNIIDLDIDHLMLRRDRSVIEPSCIRWRSLRRRAEDMCNKRDLSFCLNVKSKQNDKHTQKLMVYRPFLMHFIHRNHDCMHFVIVSREEPSTVIPHVILMEMYYNFIFLFIHLPKTKMFRVDHVIRSRVDHQNKTKSFKLVSNVKRVIGDLSHFDRIYVDGALRLKRNVWIKRTQKEA